MAALVCIENHPYLIDNCRRVGLEMMQFNQLVQKDSVLCLYRKLTARKTPVTQQTTQPPPKVVELPEPMTPPPTFCLSSPHSISVDPALSTSLVVDGVNLKESEHCLAPHKELNGSIIDTVAKCFIHQCKKGDSVQYIEGTTIQSLVSIGRFIDLHSTIKMKKSPLFLKLISVLMHNINSNHWVLVVIIKEKGTVVILDSLSSPKKDYLPVYNLVHRMHVFETGKTIQEDGWTWYNPPDMHLQQSSDVNDCGVFALISLKTILTSKRLEVSPTDFRI